MCKFTNIIDTFHKIRQAENAAQCAKIEEMAYRKACDSAISSFLNGRAIDRLFTIEKILEGCSYLSKQDMYALAPLLLLFEQYCRIRKFHYEEISRFVGLLRDGPGYLEGGGDIESSLIVLEDFDFVDGEMIGVAIRNKNITPFIEGGTFITREIIPKHYFRRIYISWGGKCPEGSAVSIEVSYKDVNNRWSKWYDMGLWPSCEDDLGLVQDGMGEVAVDILKTLFLGKSLKVRLTFKGKGNDIKPGINRLSICFTDHRADNEKDALKASITENAQMALKSGEMIKEEYTIRKNDTEDKRGTQGIKSGEGQFIEYPVPFRSQYWEDKLIAGRICGPTSLSMIMEYFGKKTDTKTVSYIVYDKRYNIFGNWSYIAAFAGENGLIADIIHCPSMNFLKEQLLRGKLGILSISFEENQLEGAPIGKSKGHLICARGITKEGDIICNDPAGKDERSGCITYKAEELKKAWLEHSGIGIFIDRAE